MVAAVAGTSESARDRSVVGSSNLPPRTGVYNLFFNRRIAMRRLALIIVAAVFTSMFTAQASAEWRTRWVPHTERIKVQVKIFPPAVPQKCSLGVEHWIQPDPYWEERTETRTYYTSETYWVSDPIIYVTSPWQPCQPWQPWPTYPPFGPH